MWRPTTSNKYGVAIYNFNQNIKHGLRLEIGETVQVLEEDGVWFRGFSTRNKNVKGIFPATYIHLLQCKVDTDGRLETVTPIENAFVTEVTYVLREWSIIWKEQFKIKNDRTSPFKSIQQVMIELMEARRQLKSGTLTQDQAKDIELRIARKIDWGNKRLGLDLVPRVEGAQVDPDRINPVELYKLHVDGTENLVNHTSSGGSIRKKGLQYRVLTHHLYMSLKSFSCSCGEDMEVYFSLYDAKEGRFFSERFVAKFPKTAPQALLKDPRNTLFTDLGNNDLVREVYLIVHVYRIGRMLPGETTKKLGPNASVYRRPFACAVQCLKDIMLISHGDGDEERDFPIRLYSCDEKDFCQLHENIIKKQSGKISQLPSGMNVSIQLLHGDLTQVRREHILLLKGVPLARKQGFSDIVLPGDVRNDLYLHIGRGEFGEKYNITNTSQRTVEVKVVVFDATGHVYQGCIHSAVGDEPLCSFNSTVFYHTNNPRWNETIKVAIPVERFDGCHVRFEFRHCSTKDKAVEKKLFAFAFLKLMNEDGITIKDGAHELYCYKCEDISKLKSMDNYIKFPSCGEDTGIMGGNTFFQRCQRDNLVIDTLLCSTKLTQNVDLLGLLQWREHPEQIDAYLNKLEKVISGEEIVKMLQDILDALFSIFDSKSHIQSVFHSLVFILHLLQENKYEHFKPVLDSYIKDTFASSLVYKDLIRCLIETIDSVQTCTVDKLEETMKVFRSLDYIFKFMIQSRILYQRASGSHSTDEQFKENLSTLFNSMHSMLSINSASMLKSQITFLQNIIQVHVVLCHVLPPSEVADVMCTLINRVPRDSPPNLTQTKLQCVQRLVNTDLFTEPEARRNLLPMCMSQVKCYLVQRSTSEQLLNLCADIIGDILIVLHRQSHFDQDIDQDIRQVVISVLDIVIKAVYRADRKSEYAGKLVACLVGLLKVMKESHYKSYLDSFSNKTPLKDFLLTVMSVFRELVKQDVFPKDWMVMRLVTDHAILTAVVYFSLWLNQNFLEASAFDKEIWINYFYLAVAFLTQTSLQLEKFTEAKKDKIIDKYGDMRVRMGFEIISMWQSLNKHKVQFIPILIGPFLEVTLIAKTELRRATLPLFIDMMEVEQEAHGSFLKVETELIDKLDIQVSENKGDEEYKELFNTILLERVQKEPTWQRNGTQFIKSVTSLLERLLDYRNVMEGDDNRDKKMTCTVNLLNFYKNEFKREEMYIRYIYKLCELHQAAKNYTEAGFTLQLRAAMLDWGDAMLHSEHNYTAQREWQRKEALYQQIIGYFDKGKSWENGIPLCKELATLYEKRFDYEKLSKILETQAQFFQKILKDHRPEREYFRVGFYGRRFPLFLRNKIFVYRGEEYEQLVTFKQRLQSEFPNAVLLTTNDPPADAVKNSDKQSIQICNVKPIASYHEQFKGQIVPVNIMSFYQVNEVDKFQYSRPFHRGEKDKDNEFKTLCLERFTLQISSKLPGILRWFEVTDIKREELSPIETAIDTVLQMNKELKGLVTSYSKNPGKNLNPLSMRLNGVIDAAVNGGITKYQEAFLSPEFCFSHPREELHITQLKICFSEEVAILKGALSLHGRLASTEMKKLHERMMEQFAYMEKDIGNDEFFMNHCGVSGSSQNSLIDLPCDSAYSSPRGSVASSNSIRSSSTSTPRMSTPSDNSNALCMAETIHEYTEENGIDDDIYAVPDENSGNKTSELVPGEDTPPPLPDRSGSRKNSEPFITPKKPKPTVRRKTVEGIKRAELPQTDSDSDRSPADRSPGAFKQNMHEETPPALPARNTARSFSTPDRSSPVSQIKHESSPVNRGGGTPPPVSGRLGGTPPPINSRIDKSDSVGPLSPGQSANGTPATNRSMNNAGDVNQNNPPALPPRPSSKRKMSESTGPSTKM